MHFIICDHGADFCFRRIFHCSIQLVASGLHSKQHLGDIALIICVAPHIRTTGGRLILLRRFGGVVFRHIHAQFFHLCIILHRFIVQAELHADFRMELQDFDLQLTNQLLGDIFFFADILVFQQAECCTVVAFCCSGVIRQVVHLCTTCIGLRLRIRHIICFFNDRRIVGLCFFILLQALVSFCTARIRFNVGRVDFYHFRKCRHRLGIIQFCQVLLSQFNLFICFRCT